MCEWHVIRRQPQLQLLQMPLTRRERRRLAHLRQQLHIPYLSQDYGSRTEELTYLVNLCLLLDDNVFGTFRVLVAELKKWMIQRLYTRIRYSRSSPPSDSSRRTCTAHRCSGSRVSSVTPDCERNHWLLSLLSKWNFTFSHHSATRNSLFALRTSVWRRWGRTSRSPAH